jgi:predicted ABC-type ATPase
LWLVAGPNGSGKSTVVASGAIAALDTTPEAFQSLSVINPDTINRRLKADGVPEHDLAAAEQADADMQAHIEAGASFVRETVLSTDRLKPVLLRAKDAGYRICLIFVVLQDPELNIARVAMRVRQGGHPVPDATIRSRWARAVALLPTFVALADIFGAWDNSFALEPPRLLMTKTDATWYITPHAKALAAAPTTQPALRAMLKKLAKSAAR